MDTNDSISQKALTSADVNGSTIPTYSGSGGNARELLKHFAGTVYAAARRNAKKVASTKLRLYEKSSTGTLKQWQVKYIQQKAMVSSSNLNEVESHPFLDLWARPNPVLTGRQQQVYAMLYLQMIGVNYLHVVPYSDTDDTPEEIYIYPAHAIRLQSSGGNLYYEIQNNSRNQIPYDQMVVQRAENLHDPYSVDPRNPGISAVRSILPELQLQERVTDTLLSIMRNQGQPSCILSPKGEYSELGEDEAERLLRRYNQFLRGGQGGAMVTDSDMTYTPLNYKPTDLAIIQIMDAIELQVCKAMQIPAMLLRGAEGGSLASYQCAVQEWCDGCITDYLRETEDFINYKILPRFKDSERLFVCYDDPTVDLERQGVQVSNMLYSSGLVTRNEGRAREGYAPTEDGDTYKESGSVGSAASSAVAPIAQPNDKPATTTTTGTAPIIIDATDAAATGDIQETALNGSQLAGLSGFITGYTTGQYPLETARQLLLAAFPIMPQERVDAIIRSLIGFTPAVPGATNNEGGMGKGVRQNKKPIPHPSGKALIPILRKAFGRQREGVLSWVGKSFGNVEVKTLENEQERAEGIVGKCLIDGTVVKTVCIKGLPSEFIASEEWATDLAEESQPVIEIFLRDSGRQLVQRVGASPSVFDVFNSNVKKRAETAALNLAQSTIETTSLAINEALQKTREALAEGLDGGESIADITKRVEDIFDGASQYRAFRIAQTEASRSHNEGLRDGAEAINNEFDGMIRGFKWIASSDPCDLCKEKDGTFIELDGEMGPLHPCCECSCLEVLGIEAGV